MKKRSIAAVLLISLLLALTGCRSDRVPLEFMRKAGDSEKAYTCIGLQAGKGKDLEEIAIPASYEGVTVTSIYNSAFKDNQHLKKIVIPDTVTAIGSGAFYNSAIEELVIPASVRWKNSDQNEEFSLYESVQRCEQLRTLVIQCPIAEFDGLLLCDSLEKLQIPATVTKFTAFVMFGQLPGLTDVYFEGTADQWMAVEFYDWYGEIDASMYSDQELIIHCSDATMRYEGIFFQEYVEFDGAWWLESTILPDYYNGVEAPALEPEPAREEEPAQDSGEMVLARIKTYMYPEQQFLESVREFTFDENGRVAKELTMERNEYTEALYEYNEEGRVIHSIETKKNYDGTVLSLEDEYTMEYDDAGQLIYFTSDSRLYGTYAMHIRYNENGWLDSAWKEYPDGYTDWTFGHEYRFNDDGSFRGVVSRDEEGFVWENSCDPIFPDVHFAFYCGLDLYRENRQDWETLMLYGTDYWNVRRIPYTSAVEECDEEGKILRYVDDNWGREYEYDRNGRVASWSHHVGTSYERYGIVEYAPLGTVTKTGAELYAPPERPSEFDW